MVKIMRPVQNLSLRKSLVLYIVLFVMFALALSIMTASVCETVANKINEKYPNTGEKYYLTNEQGERLGEGTYIYKELPVLNEQDEQLLAILDLLPTVTPPIYSAFCIIAAALLFYKNKLKKPLAELRAASEKIANNDLDFSIDYDSNDELGQLCASFEIMRTTLADNFSKMWRQVEERKALNAAFAHDLRTPLTVLKGYNEMLQASDNSQTRETAATMGKHISRMENYVSSMSNLRRMEDTQPDYKLIDLQPLVSSLYDSAKIVCTKNGKELILQNNIPILQLSLDSAFISQVCNNLISNAVRYARTLVTISFALHDNGLLLSVSDDGNGLDKDSLQKAANPYFTGESSHSEHFGLGLYICKLLCEHHNGYLRIENTEVGAPAILSMKTHGEYFIAPYGERSFFMELKTVGLTKEFGSKIAVDDLNITLANGVYGLLGANGAGKTTLMRLLCNIQNPTSGKILLNGKNAVGLGERYRSLLGYLPQHFGYYPDFSAFDFLLYVSALKGLDEKAARKKSKELLEAVDLSKESKHKIKTFSGGMKQRLGIAQAMLNDPRILILDEPTAGLDPKERVRFRNLISAFSKDRIVILSTHIVSDVEFIAEEIIMMKSGQIIHFGNPQEITSEINCQVWECTVPTAYAEKYAASYNTSNLRNTSENQTILRIVGERPPMENAVRVQPTLEDLYLFYFKGGCEE